ncbi:MAG: hypothetical protein HDR71_04155 [Lachnospiraceae bacterium]|nr:hypothetical protein [Lachnospiraceae bacterium]
MYDKERREKVKESRQRLLRFWLAKETLHGNLTEEIVDAEICRRLNDNEDDEYLVDGALLSCTSAKWEAFDLSDGGKIEIDGVEEKSKTGKATEYLRVPENPMSANNLRYATVADTKQGWNIMPFPCNCKEPALSVQEDIIKENKVDCQSHGVCKYLMDLEEEWENYDFKENLSVSVSVPYKDFMDEAATSELEDTQMSEIWAKDTAQKKKGITMTSVLFCKHGGFIYPCTSGQTVLLTEWANFISTYEFTGKQYMALYEIKDYFEKYPKLRTGWAIFVFEGLATPRSQEEENWNGENIYHSNGQFGAILIATKDGIPTCAVMKASTLPDNMTNAATICEGVYEASSVRHSVETNGDGKVIFGGYAALQLNNSNNIPAYNSITGNDYANGIHFHMAGDIHSDNPKSPYSRGCITIPVQDYLEFGVNVGFIKSEAVDDIGEIWKTYDGDDYAEAKKKLPYNTYAQEFDGYMVIDRQYYDDKNNYLKFNGSRSEE